MTVQLIALGNRLMCDDAIALVVAERMRQHLKDDQIEIVIGETDLAFCLNQIKPKARLIVLDAMLTGAPPGTVHAFPLPEGNIMARHYGQHQVSLLGLFQMLACPIRGVVIGIEVSEIRLGLALSGLLHGKLDQITEEVLQMIEEIIIMDDGVGNPDLS